MEAGLETAHIEKRSILERLRGNPVVVKELRSRMRGRRAFAVLTLYLLALGAVVGLAFGVYSASSSAMNSAADRQVLGKVIFGLVVGMELLTVSFIAPALTAGAVSAERERQTYDLVRTTLLPARSLVLGKFLAGLIFLLLLLFTALPLQSLGFLLGGVATEEIVVGGLLLLVTAGVFSAAGVFFSTLVPRTLVSTVLSYAFAILLVFGLPMFLGAGMLLINAIAPSSLGFGGNPLTEAVLILGGWLLISLNPIATAVASEVILLEEQSLWAFQLPLTNNVQLTLISPWILFTVFHLLLTVLLLWLSIHRTRRREV